MPLGKHQLQAPRKGCEEKRIRLGRVGMFGCSGYSKRLAPRNATVGGG